MDWANILWFEVSSNLPNGETVLRKTCSEPCLLGGRMIKIRELPTFMSSLLRSAHRRILEANFPSFFTEGVVMRYFRESLVRVNDIIPARNSSKSSYLS